MNPYSLGELRNRARPQLSARRGTVAVEAAFVMPLVMFLLFGVWEVGNMIHVQMILSDAAREGARLAAGGAVNGTSVAVSDVQTLVTNYMTASGLPSAAVSGAQVTLTNLSANTWTNPCDAQPLDPFTVTVTIPSGAAFNALKWVLVPSITGVTSISAQSQWRSANDAKITVSSTLPY